MPNSSTLEDKLSASPRTIKNLLYGLLLGYGIALSTEPSPYVQQHQQERQLPHAYVPHHSYQERQKKERRDLQKFIPPKW